RGTLDKYIGDAIMAFWGAPTVGKIDHPKSAALAALDMRESLANLRKEWERRGLPPLPLGIGINTGEMLVGNVGSSRLRNYTVIGDQVNIGARLESETRKFDTDIIVSQATADRLGPEFRTRHLGEVLVKGKLEPINIYALEGLAPSGGGKEPPFKAVQS
ncbi:MAG: adenylate/guanylate cyclase domain-containing protein, partial [Verrucomicrobia bacterium]|nr:adenylate/guanylate cyclase domain-containing protein [Verrucomicrobiota bacterium]